MLEQRANTLATVAASTVRGLVWTIGALWVLAILGVDVRALAIGSAFVGAALGFGAQQIVKDYLAGFLMLAENQFGVGDTVTIGDQEGVVERVSIRVTDLRDGQGTLWHIANGDIRVLGNKSSEYSTAVLDVAGDIERRPRPRAIAVVGTPRRRSVEGRGSGGLAVGSAQSCGCAGPCSRPHDDQGHGSHEAGQSVGGAAPDARVPEGRARRRRAVRRRISGARRERAPPAS